MHNASNVSVGKPRVAGAVFRAPLGTALPTDASTQLAEAYKDMGFVSDDGVPTTTPQTRRMCTPGGKAR